MYMHLYARAMKGGELRRGKGVGGTGYGRRLNANVCLHNRRRRMRVPEGCDDAWKSTGSFSAASARDSAGELPKGGLLVLFASRERSKLIETWAIYTHPLHRVSVQCCGRGCGHVGLLALSSAFLCLPLPQVQYYKVAFLKIQLWSPDNDESARWDQYPGLRPGHK